MARTVHVLAIGSWLIGCWCCTHPQGSATIQAQPKAAQAASLNPGQASDADMTARVMEAERVAWEQEKAVAWVALLAPDAAIVSGRGPTAGPFDVQFGKSEFTELLDYQFSGRAFQEPAGPFRMQLHHVLVRAEGNGDNLRLELIRVLDYDDCNGKGLLLEERTQQQYTLKRSRGTWQIMGIRAWPLSFQPCDSGPRSFSVKDLSELDAKVAKYPDTQPREKAKACFNALRYADSADWYEKAASSPKGEARDWLLLGWSAAFAGQMERARRAFAESRRRDPTLPIPTRPSAR
jgi:hypothetical protein